MPRRKGSGTPPPTEPAKPGSPPDDLKKIREEAERRRRGGDRDTVCRIAAMGAPRDPGGESPDKIIARVLNRKGEGALQHAAANGSGKRRSTGRRGARPQ